MLEVKKGYTFDDLLLVPRFSNISSRSDVYLIVDLGKGITLSAPIVSANMKNVTEAQMAQAIGLEGGLGLLHRFCTIDEQVSMLKDCRVTVGASIGVGVKGRERAGYLVNAGCKILCIDVAHGHHVKCINQTRWISEKYPEVLLIAGNVATADAARALAKAGADVIKVGIGPGSLCTTRIETGNGVPQMTALEEVFVASLKRTENVREYYRKTLSMTEDERAMVPLPQTSPKSERIFRIIADGGIKRAGDIVKALCYADAVMLGSMLAGTDEAPGSVETVNGVPCKAYEGSSTHKTSHVEGVRAHVPLKGPVASIIKRLMDGLRSGCSYQGANNLTDLKKEPTFVEISNAGLAESHPHSVIVKD